MAETPTSTKPPDRVPSTDELFNTDFANEEHLQAFAHALEADDDVDHSGPSSPLWSSKHERARKISAVSDFAPIYTKVRRRRRGDRSTHKQGLLYHVLRWPLLGLILFVIFAEFGFYVFIRQCVNAFEWLLGRGRKGVLRAKLRSAETYDEWRSAANTLDEYLGFSKWKKEDEDPYYDWPLVKKVQRSLRTLRAADDAHGVLGVLEVCIRDNFAGTESQRLYSESFIGTKDLIESYVSEVEAALKYIRTTPKLSVEEKRKFFRSANTNLGASALCLSGGASFGYYHFGVVRAFLDAGLLPRVITGTSAGGLIAALICTRTDDELRRLLIPRLADNITACEEPFRVWFNRFRKTGARFDTVQWAKKASFFTRGSLTFREAYELTGRALNVSVIPFSTHSPTKLLNHLTAPNCVIWSAIIASAAVPGILNPVVLMQKTKTGSIIPWNWGSRFKDGSLRVDIPLQSLHLLFNVNYPIVSQVNPHVHLFYFGARGSAGKPVAHRKGKGWRGGFILSAAEQFLKLELTKNFKVIRDLELLPHLLGQDWSSVFLQRFDGSVTIWPRSRIWDWLRLLTDPDRPELRRMIHVGQMVSWPKLHMIENRHRLEREIYKGRQAVRQALQAKERDRTTTIDVEDTPQASAGPSVPNGRQNTHHLPWSAGVSTHLPVESEAERGFNAGEAKFFKRLHDVADDEAGGSSASGMMNRRDDPLKRQAPRRRWASIVLRQQVEEDEDEEDESGDDSGHQAPPSIALSSNPRNSRPSSPTQSKKSNMSRSSSFLSRLRNRSFGFGSLRAQQPHANGVSRSRSSAYLQDERWSSDSDPDEDVPWSGALLTPKTSLGLDFDGDRVPEDADAHREATEVGGVDDALLARVTTHASEDSNP